MPIYKTKNENFFQCWSLEMAYVLGFFAADGSMYRTRRGAYFIEFQITDGDLLRGIQKSLASNHKINIIHRVEHQKRIYRLQIGSKVMFNDLLHLGLTPAKSKTLKLPDIPDEYFPDFLRGYFDGDGNVVFGYFRKWGTEKPGRVFSVRFTSGSPFILRQIKERVSAISCRGSIFFSSGAWRLNYGDQDSERLFGLMYHKGKIDNLLYLPRKYNIFQSALNMRW